MTEYEQLEAAAIKNGMNLQKGDRFLSIHPSGVRSKTLLELEKPRKGSGFIISQHKNTELTNEFRGKRVSAEWVKKFIEYNNELSAELSKESSYSETQIIKLKGELRQIECKCRGEVENCQRCFGSGSYTVNALGQIV